MITSELEALVQPLTYMNMDMTHIRMLYDILAVGHFHRALEIGSHDGASAIAFIEALNKGELWDTTFCDTHFKPRFFQVLDRVRDRSEIRLDHRTSIEVLNDEPSYDFVFVDGDHSLQNVREEVKILLAKGVKNIAAHDTNSSHIGIMACEGALHLKEQLRDNANYYVIEDCGVRDGEQTNRGFTFATMEYALFRKVRESVFKL